MRNLILITTLIFCISLANAQTQSNCLVPSILQSSYDKDVKHLTLKKIFDENLTYKDSIVIPQSYQDTIWEGLAAIFNLSTIVERDSVFDNYCIHQDVSNYIFQRINVSVDTNFAWTQQWRNLITTTGIYSLDSLLSTYGFTVTGYTSFGDNLVTLSTNQNINVKPLCDIITTFNGVIYSDPDQSIGDGNEIVYNKTGNERYYDFTVGYGDCLAGCIGAHIFKFKVYDNCSVDFLGTFDIVDSLDHIPTPINCYLTSQINKTEENSENKIFPNPANDYFQIVTNYDGIINFNLINLYGETIQSGSFTKDQIVSVKYFKSGMYYLQLYSQMKNKLFDYKIIKD